MICASRHPSSLLVSAMAEAAPNRFAGAEPMIMSAVSGLGPAHSDQDGRFSQ